ncbi:hypothetical protein K3495_g2701 [Podosphaera aphanis]|nr:hypothetical protein K3495_g2701 [Podosphaera aphanis]
MIQLIHLVPYLCLHFLLPLLVGAAPTGDAAVMGHGNAWKYGSGGSAIGFIVLVLDVIIFIEVLKSNRPPSHKLLWCVVVFLFPIFGLVIYWLFSDRKTYSGPRGYEIIA